LGASPGRSDLSRRLFVSSPHPEVDSFKSSSKIKSRLRFEVDFLLFYAQNERKMSEINPSKMVRGVGLEPNDTWWRLPQIYPRLRFALGSGSLNKRRMEMSPANSTFFLVHAKKELFFSL
jgi:hypothetical protein